MLDDALSATRFFCITVQYFRYARPATRDMVMSIVIRASTALTKLWYSPFVRQTVSGAGTALRACCWISSLDSKTYKGHNALINQSDFTAGILSVVVVFQTPLPCSKELIFSKRFAVSN